MNIPKNLLYTKDHEWARVEGKKAYVGITDYAQKTLREINFIYMPKKGLKLKRLQVFATVESVKALSEVYSPISGQIIETNEELKSKPTMINQDPYGEGWIIILRPDRFEEELKSLLKPKQYAELVDRLTNMDKDLLIYRWRRKE